jgi:pSer/pThr/pTyr-binding forkhead associated (FHA) protein
MEDQETPPTQGPHWRPRLAATDTEISPLCLIIEGGEAMIVVDHPDMIAGRHSEADILLPMPDVSRFHCRFSWSDGRWEVTDLGSLNGVFVNDLSVKQKFLQPGDRLRIGGFTFIVHLATAKSAGQPSLYSLFKALRPQEPAKRMAS